MGKISSDFNKSKMFEFIINSSDDAIISKTLDGIITSWNLGAAKLFGYSADEVIGNRGLMLFPGDRKCEEAGLLKKIAQGESIDHYETIRVCKDGTEVNVSINISPIIDDEGIIIGASKIARDISALKKSEKRMARNNERLEKQKWLQDGIVKLYESARGDIGLPELCQSMLTTVAKLVNASVGVMYLVEKNKLKWQSGYAYPAKLKEKNTIEFGEGFVGQCAIDKTLQYIKLNNGDEDLQITSSFIERQPNEIVVIPLVYGRKVIAVLEFGTLSNFEERHRSFIEKSALTMAIVLNAAKADDEVQKLLSDAQIQAEELKTQQEELKASNEALEVKTKILLESENELIAQSEELQASNEELEEKSAYLEEKKQEVDNKNLELIKAKNNLEQKAKDLLKTSAYKSEFLANMSHELRTPLNSLLILSKSLADNEEGNLTADQVEECKIIHGGGQELLTLINDILDLSKVEAGKMELLITEVDVENITTDMQLDFNPVAKKNNVIFEVEVAEGIPHVVNLDEQKVSQVLKNLLSNAFKFTKSGSVKLRVHKPEPRKQFYSKSLNVDNTVSFSVIDTGVGIPEDKQQEIFDAFKQADGSTSRQFGGTGLGLTISKQFAQLMGGEIQVESKVNSGSTFTLYLPISDVALKTQREASLNLQSKTEENSTNTLVEKLLIEPDEEISTIADDRDSIQVNTDKMMLIIDDDISFAKILLQACRAQSFSGIVAHSGKSGLKSAFKYKPDAILLDLGLPDISGEEVFRSLKNNLETKHIPIHIISAVDRNLKYIEKGAIGYLQKPAKHSEIKKIINDFENILEKPFKKLLVIEDDKSNQSAIKKLIKNEQLEMLFSDSAEDACLKVENEEIDCIILDLNLPDMSGVDLLNKMTEQGLNIPPVIVYTGKDLTDKEYSELRSFTSSIVVKGVDSPDRLLDEVSLFLHSLSDISRKLGNQEVKEPLYGHCVLLVDDDMRNLFALSKMLKKNGLTVEIAKDGQFALNALAENSKIELVIMDIMMPVMDGYTAIEKIREQQKYKELPIIALTAKAMPEDRQKCIDVGASDYLSKPVDIDLLLSTIRVWLGTN